MEETGFLELTGREWALREGMVLSAIGKHDRAELGGDPRAIRRASVLSLCRRSQLARGALARSVARLAVELFDATVAVHRLEPHDRELLELAALLHDIGEHVSRDGHGRHTAYLIENGGLRGFSPDEIQMLSCLGRYHIRGRPRESFQAWEALDRKDRDVSRSCCRSCGSPTGSTSPTTPSSVTSGPRSRRAALEVVVSARGDAELEQWMFQRKKGLFEELFELPISLEVVPTGPEEMQALGAEEAGLGLSGVVSVGGHGYWLSCPRGRRGALSVRRPASPEARDRRRRRRGSATRS